MSSLLKVRFESLFASVAEAFESNATGAVPLEAVRGAEGTAVRADGAAGDFKSFGPKSPTEKPITRSRAALNAGRGESIDDGTAHPSARFSQLRSSCWSSASTRPARHD